MASPKRPKPLAGLRLPDGTVTSGSRPSRTLRIANARIASAFDLRGKRVLDLGCAEGLHSLYMAQSAEHVLGVDHRERVIRRAEAAREALGVSNATFRCVDVRDPSLWEELSSVDLVIAWGFLHRITDVFTFLSQVATVGRAVSLEWRTPVFPLMSRLSGAYHSPAGDELDPMNLKLSGRSSTENAGNPAEPRREKIEGDTSFWEPTPGAVARICKRFGYEHARILGYGANLSRGSVTVLERSIAFGTKALQRRRFTRQLPAARVHMLLEKEPGSIGFRGSLNDDALLPEWDVALREHARRLERRRSRLRSMKRLARRLSHASPPGRGVRRRDS